MHGRNVFRLEQQELPIVERPRQKTFREAVAKVIRDIKSKEGISNTELAEEIGCCPDTIGNAENKEHDTKAIHILASA